MNHLLTVRHGLGLVAAFAALLPACSAATAESRRVGVALLDPPARLAERERNEMQITRDLTGRPASPRLDLNVERLWSENGVTWATLSVRNTASFELVKITVDCTAFGTDEVALEVGRRTLHAPGERPIGPGMAKTAKIFVGSQPDLRSMSCEARAL
ncbi:MAG: hypothetical protein ACREQ9_25385 [Candidatus Binatia bacterium]